MMSSKFSKCSDLAENWYFVDYKNEGFHGENVAGDVMEIFKGLKRSSGPQKILKMSFTDCTLVYR